MTDYIKRESRTFIEIADDLNDLVTELNDKIVESIREKNADFAPVRHGRWMKDKMPMYSWGGEKIGEKSTWECSECHDVGFWGYNYCPNCGAKMDK